MALPVAVFGSDDRMPTPAKYKDVQEKIGLFFNLRRRTVCTAFCVAPDVIATAGHCLLGTVGERPARFGDFSFARNFDAVRDQVRIAGHANGTATQHVMVGSMTLSTRPPIDASRDWALVRLARPACSKGVLPLRVLPIEQILSEATAQHVFQIAYHRDYIPWKPAYSRPCGVAKSFGPVDWKQIERDFADPEALLLHTCDTGGASSGSPILLDTPDGPEVIGINVGTYQQSKVLMQDGEVKKRLKADTIANTGVASAAFAGKLGGVPAGGDSRFRGRDARAAGTARSTPALFRPGGRHLRRRPQDGDRGLREGRGPDRDGARDGGAAAAAGRRRGGGAGEAGAAGEDLAPVTPEFAQRISGIQRDNTCVALGSRIFRLREIPG